MSIYDAWKSRLPKSKGGASRSETPDPSLQSLADVSTELEDKLFDSRSFERVKLLLDYLDEEHDTSCPGSRHSSRENVLDEANLNDIGEVLDIVRTNCLELLQSHEGQGQGPVEDIIKESCITFMQTLQNKVGNLHWAVAGFSVLAVVLKRAERILSAVGYAIAVLQSGSLRILGRRLLDLHPQLPYDDNISKRAFSLIMYGMFLCWTLSEPKLEKRLSFDDEIGVKFTLLDRQIDNWHQDTQSNSFRGFLRRLISIPVSSSPPEEDPPNEGKDSPNKVGLVNKVDEIIKILELKEEASIKIGIRGGDVTETKYEGEGSSSNLEEGSSTMAAASSAGDKGGEQERKQKQEQSTLTLEEKYQLVRSIGEECIQEDELRILLDKKPNVVAYDGFEPSGRMHIAQGVMKMINVNKLTRAGCTFKFWVADYFALLNNKMGGDLKKIQTVGKYMIEIWKAVGMDMQKVEFLWASEEINKRGTEYWSRVLDIARANTLTRIKRCSQIMGRKDEDELSAGQIIYPCMQCADIFFLKADICQLGMDQRKVNVLAREYCTEKKQKLKPIILSHHMLPGLTGEEKMSKSVTDSAIFMEDDEANVMSKIRKAFCPPQVVEKNPIVEYTTYIGLPYSGEFVVERAGGEADGGTTVYTTAKQLHEDYKSGALHPNDLKTALSKALNKILQPVRDHFKNNAEAKSLLAKVKSYKVSR